MRVASRNSIAAALLASAMLLLLIAAPAADAAYPGRPGLIVFSLTFHKGNEAGAGGTETGGLYALHPSTGKARPAYREPKGLRAELRPFGEEGRLRPQPRSGAGAAVPDQQHLHAGHAHRRRQAAHRRLLRPRPLLRTAGDDRLLAVRTRQPYAYLVLPHRRRPAAPAHQGPASTTTRSSPRTRGGSSSPATAKAQDHPVVDPPRRSRPAQARLSERGERPRLAAPGASRSPSTESANCRTGSVSYGSWTWPLSGGRCGSSLTAAVTQPFPPARTSSSTPTMRVSGSAAALHGPARQIFKAEFEFERAMARWPSTRPGSRCTEAAAAG